MNDKTPTRKIGNKKKWKKSAFLEENEMRKVGIELATFNGRRRVDFLALVPYCTRIENQKE